MSPGTIPRSLATPTGSVPIAARRDDPCDGIADVQDREALPDDFRTYPERRHRIDDGDAVQFGRSEQFRRTADEQTVCGGGIDLCRTCRSAGLGCTHQRAAGADQIIDDHRNLAVNVTGERLAADNAAAAVLFHVGAADILLGQLFQMLAELFRPLGPAGVR